MINENFYIIRSEATIKNVPQFLDSNFLKDLKTSNNELKPHISNLDTNSIYYGKKCIKCTIPTLFIEITYKDSERDVFLIDHEVLLYSEDMPTLKDLENYKSKFDFNFASQVNKEVYEIVEAYHQ